MRVVYRRRRICRSYSSRGLSGRSCALRSAKFSRLTGESYGVLCSPGGCRRSLKLTKLRLPPRGASYEAPHFDVEQVQKILAIAEEPWRTMFCIFTMDGVRAGEALGLQWPDVGFDRGLLQNLSGRVRLCS